MWQFLKYYLLFAVAVTLLNGLGREVYSSYNDYLSEPFEQEELSTYISELPSDPCLPSRIVNSVTFSLKTGARKDDRHIRDNYNFLKAGKLLNPQYRYNIRRSLISGDSSLTNPNSISLLFSKLII